MPTRLTTTEARQATTVRGTSECHFFVASLVLLPGLVASTIGAFILLAGLYLYYFGWPF